jgi:hypothetical protein
MRGSFYSSAVRKAADVSGHEEATVVIAIKNTAISGQIGGIQ